MRLKSTLVPRWALGLLLFLGVAVITYVVSLRALPWLIMQRAMVAVGGDAPPAPALPPMTDHEQRRVVMPSPDLLYATCVWDVSTRPLQIQATLGDVPYASLALYAANSDNFHVVNTEHAAGKPVNVWLIGPGAYPPGTALPPAGAQTVTAPTAKGLLLMRVLVGDPKTDLARAEQIRRQLRCEPVGAGS